MTLLLIAMVGLFLSRVAGHSLNLAMATLEAQEDLQWRWGTISCARAILDQADEILQAKDIELSRRALPGNGSSMTGQLQAARVEFLLSLGNLTFELVLGDEQAKVNVNKLNQLTSEQEATSIVRTLSHSRTTATPRVFLRPHKRNTVDQLLLSDGPLRDKSPNAIEEKTIPREELATTDSTGRSQFIPRDDGDATRDESSTGEVDERRRRARETDENRSPFRSWGQVFALDDVDNDAFAPHIVATATTDITCWGDGKLNVYRASDETLESLCQFVAGMDTARRLTDIRRREPRRRIDELLSLLQLDDKRRGLLKELLTDRSSCYSLWITASDSRRPRGEFYVAVSEPKSDATESAASTSPNQSDSPRKVRVSRFMW